MFSKKKKIIINPNINAISVARRNVEDTLKLWNVSEGNIAQALLSIEELLVQLSPCINDVEKIHILLCKSIRQTSVRITIHDTKLDIPQGIAGDDLFGGAHETEPSSEKVIRNMILRATSNLITSKYSHGINTFDILVEHNKYAMVYYIIIAVLAIAFILGLVYRVYSK